VFSALHIRHFLPKIQSNNRKEGRDAFEGVLLDFKCGKIKTERKKN
jgi:hypothetical protein